MMFSLSTRFCILEARAKADGKENDAGENYTRLSLNLADIKLDATELNALLQERDAHGAIYDAALNPRLRSLKALEIADSIVDAYVKIGMGLDAHTSLEFTPCKISKIRLEPQAGGETSMSLRIETAPAFDGSIAELFEHLGHQVQLELRGEAPGAQTELPLNRHTDDGEQARLSNTGRQIQAAAAKTARKKRRADALKTQALN